MPILRNVARLSEYEETLDECSGQIGPGANRSLPACQREPACPRRNLLANFQSKGQARHTRDVTKTLLNVVGCKHGYLEVVRMHTGKLNVVGGKEAYPMVLTARCRCPISG